MKICPSIRVTNLYAFFLCFCLLGAAAYFQIVEQLEPCPLCILQRVSFFILASLFLLGIFKWSKTVNRVHQFFVFFISLFGALLAGRQIWLQHLPADQIPACGPSLSFMLQNLPYTDTIRLALQGSGECAEVQWQFFGLSMPGWALLFFGFFMLLAFINFKRA